MANVIYDVIITTNPIFEVIVNNGAKGNKGDKGDTGEIGKGVATGGVVGQYLHKKSSTDYDTEFKTIDSTEVAHGDGNVSEALENRYTESEVDALLDGKSPIGHTHDDRYYTETESDSLLDDKVDKVDGSSLMFNTDKTKLDGIEAGAEVNVVDSVAGRTGDVVLAKADVGLGNVDNTSDANKPVSTAQATALGDKVDKVAGKELISSTTLTDLTDGGDTPLHTHKIIQNEVAINNSKVETLSTGTKISRNIADANPALIVNQANAGSTGDLLKLQKGGSDLAKIDQYGQIFGANFIGPVIQSGGSGVNNGSLNMYTTGIVIRRNVADPNTCIIINQANAGSTGLITDFQFGGVSKASVDRFGTIANAKSAHNPDGGFMIKLTNKTGAASVKGNTVRVNSGVDNSFVLTIDTAPDCFGVVYQDGIADGAECWVVVSGIADVYFIGSTTRGHLARTFIASEAGYVTGQALSEAVPSSPFASDKHFCEIGHVLSARTGAGLAKVVLHFN